MLNLYTFVTKNDGPVGELTEKEKVAVAYHDLFDYPLSFAELIKWSGRTGTRLVKDLSVTGKNGFYVIEGREGLIYKRLLRKRISAKKVEIAKKASRVLSFIPTVKMVALTGSLAMENSTDESDIDLMVVTRKGSLWTTRLASYLVSRLFGLKTRRPMDKSQKDRLCLNIWLDESNLIWREGNIYTAHEIAQIVPLANKDRTYEKFLYKNKWILDFWPNAVRIKPTKILSVKCCSPIIRLLEKIAYRLQYFYMKKKITRETVTPTRAIFHPEDWGQVVLDRLKTHLVE